jgi:hypothetical protein
VEKLKKVGLSIVVKSCRGEKNCSRLLIKVALYFSFSNSFIKLYSRCRVEVSTVTNETFAIILQKFMDKQLYLISRFPELFDSVLDPSTSENTFLVWAAFFGHSDVVRYLLRHPKVDPAAINNYALRMAAFKGRTKVVKLLLNDNRVDPCVQHHYPVRWAKENRHQETVDLLMSDPRISSTYVPIIKCK